MNAGRWGTGERTETGKHVDDVVAVYVAVAIAVQDLERLAHFSDLGGRELRKGVAVCDAGSC